MKLLTSRIQDHPSLRERQDNPIVVAIAHPHSPLYLQKTSNTIVKGIKIHQVMMTMIQTQTKSHLLMEIVVALNLI
jgi:hypothetical protein